MDTQLYKWVRIFIFVSLFIFFSCATSPKEDEEVPFQASEQGVAYINEYTSEYTKDSVEGDAVEFKEIYGYLMKGQEDRLDNDAPLSSLAYFDAEVDTYGNLGEVPKREKLKGFSGKVYLVATCQSRSLTHFVLDPVYGIRNNLVQQLLNAAQDYDGIDVDFELIPKRDNEHYFEFLSLLKKGLGKKPMRVCAMARMRTLSDDAFSYSRLAGIADAVMIMAYDEHWANSKPGAVASIDWCKRIAEYALGQIPADKLIMGMPFYGRSWGEKNPSRAYRFVAVRDELSEYGVTSVERENGIPHCEYEFKTHVNMWFEDAYSTIARARMYRKLGVQRIAFWAIGQEDSDVWKHLKLSK